MPDDLDADPDTALEDAQRLLDEDRPFHAHEVLEAAWKGAPAAERELWRGLAQLAVGLTHLRRGNQTGAVSLLSRAADRIAEWSAGGVEVPHGIDAAGLVDWARRVAGRTDAPADVPRLRLP